MIELYTIKKDGFLVQQFTHVGQWGTHIDAPAHFHEGLRTADQIDPEGDAAAAGGARRAREGGEEPRLRH